MADGAIDDAAGRIDRLLAFAEHLNTSVRARIDRIANLGSDWDALLAGIAASGQSAVLLAAAILLVAGVAVAVFIAKRRYVDRRYASGILSLVAPPLAGAVAALAVALLLSGRPGPLRSALILFAVAIPMALLVRDIVGLIVRGRRVPLAGDEPVAAFSRMMGRSLAYGVAGTAVLILLRQFQAGFGLRDLTATLLVAVPMVSLSILAYARWGRAVAISLSREWAESRLLRRLALRWPNIAIMLIAAAFVIQQISITIGAALPGFAFLTTLGAALLWPHLDAGLARWAAAGLGESKVAIALVAVRRTARPALVILIVSGLIGVWGRPIAVLTGVDVAGFARSAVGIGAMLLFGAFLWNLIGAGVDRVMAEDGHAADHAAGDEAHAPRSRLGTLLPLVGASARVAIVALTALSMLLAMGVNVWPLVTGLSVFGLAIGFGSQTLVKDIVSGIFFLVDDAFRLGEYIETSGAKGTVEKISVRSVSLRHPRGALATIPYGQIGKIQNFSRDWVIEKLTFRVAFDTDVDKVKKLFKQIGQEIAADPELAPDLLEPFKSQGIGAVEDNTIVLRGKFKAKAGQQFAIRKAVFARVQKGFQENGIKTVPRPLPVTP